MSETGDQGSEVRLTSGGRGLLPPSEQTWFSSQTSALQSTSSTWCKATQLISKGPYMTHLHTWLHERTLTRHFTLTVKWINSWLRCPDSHVGYQQWGREQTCEWSLYLALILRHLEPPSACLPHWRHKHDVHRVRDKEIKVSLGLWMFLRTFVTPLPHLK